MIASATSGRCRNRPSRLIRGWYATCHDSPGERAGRGVEDGRDAVPGPSAAIAALVISGLPTDRFVFEGFLPRRAAERRRRLEALAEDPRTIVLFESPKRVAATLQQAGEILGDRRVAVARELTKLH